MTIGLYDSMQRLFYALARVVLGAVFLYASYDKVLHPAAFAEAVFNYQLLPDFMINLTAIALPWLELMLGVLLIAGIWLPGTTVLCTLLLTIFIGAIVFNLARGLDISCGCFSTSPSEGPVSVWTILRDAVFLLMAVYLCFVTFFQNQMPSEHLKHKVQ